MPLTNDDNYIIMATMTNNNTITKKGVIKMSFSDLCFACAFGVLSAWMWVAIVTL